MRCWKLRIGHGLVFEQISKRKPALAERDGQALIRRAPAAILRVVASLCSAFPATDI
jgi:hypothetical protein